MKSVKYHQPFVLGPSRRYISTTLVELPILVTRLDGREDVLVIQTQLLVAEAPFLCRKQTLESWNFKIDGREKVLEIQMKSDQDCSRKLIKIIDTVGGYYGIILETRRKKNSNVLFMEDDSGILFLEDARDNLCSQGCQEGPQGQPSKEERAADNSIKECWIDKPRTCKYHQPCNK